MENYSIIEKIGKGTHGTVYLLQSHLKSTESHSKSTESKLVVCKTIDSKYKTHAYREISILSRLTHRRIVGLLDSFVIKGTVHIILEYINYGSVESMVEFFSRSGTRPSPSLGWSLLAQMADVLHYLHSRRVVHRDVKPANILVSRFFVKNKEHLEFKLCDFSLSARCEGMIDDGHVVGTPFYMAPEIVERKTYGTSVDVWGLGCTVYELMELKKPFRGETRKELFERIMKEEIGEIDWEDDGLESAVKQCLVKEGRIGSKALARQERMRLQLAMVELRIKENRIEELEGMLKMLK